MSKRVYPPQLPPFVSRLELTWEFVRSKIGEFLEKHPLDPDLCHACFIIYIHSLFSYLLPDTILLQEELFCELEQAYEFTSSEYKKAKRKRFRSTQWLIYDFELALHRFTEKHFDCGNELVYKHIVQLCEYQRKVWDFCLSHDIQKLDYPPLPYHDSTLVLSCIRVQSALDAPVPTSAD